LTQNATIGLRTNADNIAGGMPALIASARQLAATLSMGVHGRRRSGMGEEFWQYRQADVGDNPRDIDWRRSAQGDQHYVRQTEWQTAQAVYFWVDQSASMQFRAGNPTQSKCERAQVLGLATAILLAKGGERFAHLDDVERPKSGDTQVTKFAEHMVGCLSDADFGMPESLPMARGSRAVLLSDFLGDWDDIVTAVSRIADQDVQGSLIQILDPHEMSFPFKGRTIFKSMLGTLSFEARRANSLREDYLQRLAERQDALQSLARRTGWRYTQHQTDASAQTALMWIYTTLDAGG
jgi:uncharacterized protein (DUF58 family)